MISAQTRKTLARFVRAERGNIAATFAIVLVPLLAFIGVAVDYSRANSARSAMQGALDSAALMVSKDIAASSMTAAEITAKATVYFNALYTNPNAPQIQVTATYTPNSGKGSSVVLTGAGTVKTDFMKVVGFPQMNINGSAGTAWGSTRLRVALVLDTTGSMGQSGKIDALKTATHSLLTQLQSTASSADDVYVSIIPFSKDINADPGNYNANWIDWTDWLAEPAIIKGSSNKPNNWSNYGPGSNCPFTDNAHGFTCTDKPATTSGASSVSTIPSTGYICPSIDSGNKNRLKIGLYYNGCYNSVPTVTTSSATVSNCNGRSNCTCTHGTCTQLTTTSGAPYTHIWRPADTASPVTAADTAATPAKSTWNGCVTERGLTSGPSGEYDRTAVAPIVGTAISLFPAEQTSYCSPVVLPLTNNWSTMSTKVDSLYPLGGTNQPIGLVAGWQSLVGIGPFPAPPPKDINYTYRDIIVLMSDGLNTQDRWYGDGSTTNTSVDARMYESATLGTCANIKAALVTIYTVHVNTDGGPASTLLQNCASLNSSTGVKEFQMVTSAAGIGTAFNTIATQLSQLRVAF